MGARTLAIPVVTAALAMAATSAHAGKEEDVLRWASNSEPDNIDMYYNTLREGIILGRHIWDNLMEIDPETGEFRPSLAKSYEWVDDTTIDFELKEGITFHNGEPFDADDVVHTINFVTDPANKVQAVSRIQFIEGAEKLGPYKARINLKYPFPAAMQYLSSVVPIYPNEYYSEAGPEGMAKNPVGTGPYKAVDIGYGDKFVFELNEDYDHGPKDATIGGMEFRRIEERGTQVAELLSGGVDWIWRVPPDLAQNLEGRDGITVTSGETMRIGFIQMDAAGRTGTENNPMTDLKVRQAISHAIDREAIRDALMGGSSRIVHVACYPTQFGCIDDSAPRYEHDPEKAKRLLEEAGYPDGFEVEFYAYRDRPIAEAIIGDLREVGIKANLNYLTAGAYREQRRNEGTRLAFGTWGSSSINDVTAILGNWFQGSSDDHAQDPEVIAQLERGNTLDEEVRMDAYEQALTRIAEQAYWLPLFSWSYNYAYTDDLEFEPSADEVPRFWNARWKEDGA